MTTAMNTIVWEPVELVKAQPHQALISVASVALMAQFAASGGILHPAVGLVLAIGVEWAYLRGLASDAKAATVWGEWLNWSAFGIVVLWGGLWCLKAFGVIPERPVGALAYVMAAAHVVPIAWLSLCSAMTHRASAQLAEQQEREREAERNALELERARKLMEVEVWKAGRAAVLEMQGASAQNAPAPHSGAVDASPKVHRCASCGAALTMKQYAASRRWGHCRQCKATHE
jgi:hypothetical protein